MITGLHLLLTYRCNFECDHCFVFGSPRQSGTMTLRCINEILDQAEKAGTIEWIYFEGGEPFLYYAALLAGVQAAAGRGFKVGIVSNGYWATGIEDARTCLKPMAGLVQDLTLSSDAYHWDEKYRRYTDHARLVADQLGISVNLISIAQPEETHCSGPTGKIPAGESAVVFRGRAVEKLASRASQHPWQLFTECPFEDLIEPERVHLDPFGYVHICQGISIGNMFKKPLHKIFSDYDPATHPVTGPLLRRGPAELVRCYGLEPKQRYADACHFCYEARLELRAQFPEALAPDQMYGVTGH